MSKVKILSIAVISLLLLNIGLVVFILLHQQPRPPHSPRGPEMEERGPTAEGRRPEMDGRGPKLMIIEKLQFDAAQQAQYEILISEHQHAIKETNDSISVSKKNLYQLLNTNLQTAAKDAIIENIGRLQQKIEQTHYAHFEAIKKICNPSQLESFTALTTELANFFPSGRREKLPRR